LLLVHIICSERHHYSHDAFILIYATELGSVAHCKMRPASLYLFASIQILTIFPLFLWCCT